MDKEKENINNLPVEENSDVNSEESSISLKVPEVSNEVNIEKKKNAPVIEEEKEDEINISVEEKSEEENSDTSSEPSESQDETTNENESSEEGKVSENVSTTVEETKENEETSEEEKSKETQENVNKEVSSNEENKEEKSTQDVYSSSLEDNKENQEEKNEEVSESTNDDNANVEEKESTDEKEEKNETSEEVATQDASETKDNQDAESNQEETEDSTVSNPVDNNAEEALPVEQDSVNTNESNANMEMPAFTLEEEKTEDVVVEGQKTDMQADFSAIFNVESEEVPEMKVAANSNEVPQENSLGAPAAIEVPEEVPIVQKKKDLKEDFNADERVIFTYQEEKEGNPIVVVLFFAVILVFMFLLPVISKGSTAYLNSFAHHNNQNQNNNGEVGEDEFYFYRSSNKIKIGDLEFSNFIPSKSTTSEEYRITFTMTNYGQKVYQFDKKYYIELYSGEQLLGYSLLHSYEPLPPLAAREVTLITNQRGFESSDRVKIEEILVSKYPNVTLREQEGDYDVLTCSYLNDKMQYYFLEGKLSKIKETYESEADKDLEYVANKTKSHDLWERYKTIENFESLYIEYENSFKFVNQFELKNIQDKTLSNLNSYKFFKYNEFPNVIAFEMAAQGYVCG